MKNMLQAIIKSRLWKEEHGQDMVEYALLAGFITVAVTAAFPPVSASISTIFSRLGSMLTNAAA